MDEMDNTSHVKDKTPKQVKVQVTLSAENHAYLTNRLAQCKAQGIDGIKLAHLVHGCITICRDQKL
jgi:hypothetical protein